MKIGYIQSMKVIFLALILVSAGCGRLFPKQTANTQLNELSQKMIDYCFSDEKETADVTDTLLEYKKVVDDVYKGEMTPQVGYDNMDELDEGLAIEVYPEDAGAATGATVAKPVAATLAEIYEVILHDDYTEVMLDPQRYYVYEREFTVGTKADFSSKSTNWVVTRNYQEDVGQSGVSLRYYTDMTFRRFTKSDNESMPDDGVVVVCNKMDGEAENNDVYNAFMTALYSFSIWYPIDESTTYRINATWLNAGGGLSFINVGANSGNVAKGINDETESIMNCIETGCYL